MTKRILFLLFFFTIIISIYAVEMEQSINHLKKEQVTIPLIKNPVIHIFKSKKIKSFFVFFLLFSIISLNSFLRNTKFIYRFGLNFILLSLLFGFAQTNTSIALFGGLIMSFPLTLDIKRNKNVFFYSNYESGLGGSKGDFRGFGGGASGISGGW